MYNRYRVHSTLDPEERIEDACMAKAMHDVLGCEIVSEGQAEYGLGISRKNIEYWNDVTFIRNTQRGFWVLNYEDAKEKVEEIHKSGKHAFVKATELKLYTGYVEIGQTLQGVLGDMVYSFLDRQFPCLMVQEYCDIVDEMRFVVIDRKIVTYSKIHPKLTPMPYGIENNESYIKPDNRIAMLSLVTEVAKYCKEENVIIDCAIINKNPGIVEFNPFSIGNFGLYQCNPYAIAHALKTQMRYTVKEGKIEK